MTKKLYFFQVVSLFTPGLGGGAQVIRTTQNRILSALSVTFFTHVRGLNHTSNVHVRAVGQLSRDRGYTGSLRGP